MPSRSISVHGRPPSVRQPRLSPALEVAEQVPRDRRQEIERYLRLFGYKPERTILQVHVAGSFGRSAPPPRELARRQAATSRYGGHTFTVVGRTHDPSLAGRLVPPRRSRDLNPGYLGYLFAGKDEGGKAPHELLPLDFIPNGMVYPGDWKAMFNTPG